MLKKRKKIKIKMQIQTLRVSSISKRILRIDKKLPHIFISFLEQTIFLLLSSPLVYSMPNMDIGVNQGL